MINAQYINLNMTPSGVMPVLYCSQHDIGRPLGMVVYNGSEAVDLSAYTVTIEGTRSDNTPVLAAVTTDGNIGAFATTATMTNEADTYLAKMVIMDSSGNRVASLAFVLCVTPKTMDENAESIEEDASLYQQYTTTVQTIIAQIRSDLTAEIANRQSAVSAEAAARQAAVSAEASARQAAVSAEATARQTADNALQSAISSEASTRVTQDASLQSQIDQLIAPSGEAPSAAEIQNARIGADGVTYHTLGNAIRTQVTDVKSAIDQETGTEKITLTNGYVTCNTSPVNLTPTVNKQWQYAVVPCSEGDVFTLTGQGGNGPRLWCFVDSQRNIIENANSSISLSDVAISAPSEATHFIFNDNTLSGYLYHGKTDVADKTETDANKKSLFEYNSVNLLDYSKLKTQTINGVTFEPTENGILVSGQATATVLYRMCGLQVDMGIKFVPGKAYAIKYKSTKVRFQIRDDSNIYLDTTTDAIYIPSVVESQCALVVSSGVTVNEVVQPFIFNSLSNAELEELATENLVPYMRHDNVSENGITWTWVNNSQITVSGTATDGSVLPLIAQADTPPDDFKADYEYFIDFLDDDAHMAVRAYDANGDQILYTDFNTPSFFGLPHGTASVALSLVVSSGTTVNKTLNAPKIYQKMRLEDLSKIVGQVSNKVGYADQIPTDDECVNVFVAELNALAASWGMSDTIIASPSGLDTESFMSVADMLKAAIACLSSPDLLDIASTSDFTMPIYGQHARTITVRNSYLSAIKNKFILHDDYALGGKGGSLTYTETDRTRTQLTYADIGGHLTALCLMGKGETSYENIYDTCNDVSLAIKAVYTGEEPVITENMTEIVESGGGYVAVECPESGILYAKQMPAAKIIEKYKSVSAGTTSINRPCSVIKMMSTMLALKYIVDKSAFISLHLSDLSGGSGSSYYVGDKINVIDMLKAMLVESSNTLAVAMARHIGASILSGRR